MLNFIKEIVVVVLGLYATLLLINTIYVLIGELPVEDIFKL